jgi:MFS family permease
VTRRTTVNRFDVDDAGLAALLVGRDDLLLEAPDAEHPARFTCAVGPFDEYERTVDATPLEHQPGRHAVTEQIRWTPAIPLWGRLFGPLIARQLQRSAPPALDAEGIPVPARSPWWSPPDRLDARGTSVLSRLCGLSMLTGYLGTTITQTLTFAADEFGATKAAQGTTLSAVRVGILLSLVLMAMADRRGRKRILAVCAVGGAVASALGALSPSLWFLGGTQSFARAFSTALALLIGVVAAEEMPSGGRAYAASVLAMTAALGAGLAVALLPVAEVAEPAWRIIYLIPLIGLPFFLRVADHLPESRRFLRPHGPASLAGHGGRLLLLAAAGFFGLLFLAPASQFQNDFLRNEHGFAAWQLTVFTFATATPAGIGIVVGGRLADQRGRRPVGAIGVVGGAVLLSVGYNVGGPALWGAFSLGAIVAAATVPALGVYGPELFPTSLRAKANGIITLGSVAGSAVGLTLAGRMADRWGSMGPGIAVLAVGPVIVALLVVALYPETAHIELEDLNPEDALDLSGRHIPPPVL